MVRSHEKDRLVTSRNSPLLCPSSSSFSSTLPSLPCICSSSSSSSSPTFSHHRFLCLVTFILLSLAVALFSSLRRFDSASRVESSNLAAVVGPVNSDLTFSSLPAAPRPYVIDLTPPLTRDGIGGAAWSFLHQLAAIYPETPSAEEQQNALNLVQSLTILYPCRFCRLHFKSFASMHESELKEAVKTRRGLSVWLCKAHNSVNRRNSKKEVQCERPHDDQESEMELMWPPHLTHVPAPGEDENLNEPEKKEDCNCGDGEEQTVNANQETSDNEVDAVNPSSI